VNLPAAKKMTPPRYQDIAPERIPELDRDGARVRVIAGNAFETLGPVSGIDVDPVFVDIALARGATVSHALPPGHAAFVYVVTGAVRLGRDRREVRRRELAVLGAGDLFSASSDAETGRFLLFAGRPLGEPVSRSGPFVMSTDAEIRQAWDDYRSGRLVGG
jgi:redox-sensitive bicupin YhaK (pirin superfamily)